MGQPVSAYSQVSYICPLSVEEHSNRLVNPLAESYLPRFFAKARGSQEDTGEYVLLTVINIVGPMLTSHSNLMQ